jgi:hypothetical protein
MRKKFYLVVVKYKKENTYDVTFHDELVFKDVPHETVVRYLMVLNLQDDYSFEVKQK